MPVLRFQMNSSMSPSQVLAVLTDFGPERAKSWPTIDADHFVVHELGDTWAEVTEGTAKAWERARYEWKPDGDTVVITTLDSKAFGPGGGWVFKMTPQGEGSRIDIQLERYPRDLKGKVVAAILPFAGSVFRKSFTGPLKGI